MFVGENTMRTARPNSYIVWFVSTLSKSCQTYWFLPFQFIILILPLKKWIKFKTRTQWKAILERFLLSIPIYLLWIALVLYGIKLTQYPHVHSLSSSIFILANPCGFLKTHQKNLVVDSFPQSRILPKFVSRMNDPFQLCYQIHIAWWFHLCIISNNAMNYEVFSFHSYS